VGYRHALNVPVDRQDPHRSPALALVGEYHERTDGVLSGMREGFARLDAREITPRRTRGPRRSRPRRDEAEELQQELDAALAESDEDAQFTG
jgi:hypothetical protein